MESTSILRKLASVDFIGAAKFVFDKGKLSQVVESQTAAVDGATCLDDLHAAGELLRIARQVELTGYIVVYIRPQEVRATYVRTQAGSFDESMTFERAFSMRSKGGQRWRA